MREGLYPNPKPDSNPTLTPTPTPTRYTLRMREGLYGSWRMMTEHREGRTPYLREMGRVEQTLTLSTDH